MYAAIHARAARLVASEFSPCVEETSPEIAVIHIAGLLHLFDSSPRKVAEAIAQRAGEPVNVAVAANPDAAVHAARGIPGISVMADLRPLPLDLLAPPPEIATTLAMWGIRTFGELAALPAGGVAERLGPAGAHLQKLARGEGDRPLQPSSAPLAFEESFELEYPLTLLEPLAFILGRLLGALCARLESHGSAAHEIRVRLRLEKGEHERTLRLPFPMRDARAFLKLVTLDLEAHPPDAPVAAVWIAAEPVNPRVVQHGLFLPPTPEPQKLELTLARIAKLVGEENVGAAELLDTHRPDAFRVERYGRSPRGHSCVRASATFDKLAQNVPGGILATGGAPAHLALRVFRPALTAQVDAAEGRPARIAARGVRGRVTAAAGPWRSSGEWWRADAWSRDEWDVALNDGALYRLYRDRRRNEWFLEGEYD